MNENIEPANNGIRGSDKREIESAGGIVYLVVVRLAIESVAKELGMKKEYDFSRGVRGKFFRPNAKFNVPVYLDGKVQRFVERIAERKRTDVSAVVNRLLRSEMELVEAAK